MHWPMTGLELSTLPSMPAQISLPWDAADEYLVEFFKQRAIAPPDLIINDRHGALSCAFPTSSHWLESDCARRAALQNRKQNRINDDIFWRVPSHTGTGHTGAVISGTAANTAVVASLNADTCTEELVEKPTAIVIKISKNMDQLSYWLEACQQQYSPGSDFLLASMAKHIPVSWLKWLESISSEYEQLPIRKKARLIRLRLKPDFKPIHKTWAGYSYGPLTFHSLPGVYGREQPDQGGAFLLSEVRKLGPEWLKGQVCDLGCGNGLIGLALKQANPGIDMLLVDDSLAAVVSATANAHRADMQVTVLHRHCLTDIDARFDRILCNPPFHDGHKQLTNIAEQMFEDSSQRLTANGQLLVVANRHLPYGPLLKRRFGQVEQKGQHAKFMLYLCTRPKARLPHPSDGEALLSQSSPDS